MDPITLLNLARHLIVQSQATRGPAVATPRAAGSRRRKTPETETSSDEDIPLASSSPVKSTSSRPAGSAQARQPALTKATSKFNKVKIEDDTSSDARSRKKVNSASKQPPKKRVKREDEDVEMGSVSEGEKKPLVSKKRVTSRKRKAPTPSEEDSTISSEEEVPLKAGKRRTKKAKKEESEDPPIREKTRKAEAKSVKGANGEGANKNRKKEKTEEDQEDIYRWWDTDANGDGSVKWQTLEHNGVFFPAQYETLPKYVKMKYDGLSFIK
jgi:DNA topoisomerase I